MAKVKINCYADKSDLEALRDQDLYGTISFVMSTKEIYLGKDKYCDASSEVAQAITNNLKNYYNKAEIDKKIAEAAAGGTVDLSGYVTKSELDGLATKAEVAKKADKVQLDNLATKSEVSSKADKTDLTGLATKSEVGTIKTTAEGAKSQAQTNKSDIASIKTQLNSVATKEDLKNIDIALFDVVTKLPGTGKTNKVYLVPDTTSTDTQNKYIEYAWINSKWEKIGEFNAKVDLSNYYTKTETYVKLGEVKDIAERAEGKADANKASLAGKADKSELTDLATKSELGSKADKSDLTGLATKSEVSSKADKSDLTGLATKSELGSKADKSDLTGLATKSEVGQAKQVASSFMTHPEIIVVDSLPNVMIAVNNNSIADKYKIFAVLDPDSTDPEERYIKYRPVQDKDTNKWRWERIGRCAPTKKEFDKFKQACIQDYQRLETADTRTAGKIAQIESLAYRTDKLTLNGTKLEVGQVNARGARNDNLSVDLAPLVPKKPDVKHVECQVNIMPWDSCTDVDVCGLTNTDPYVINRYIMKSGLKTYPYRIGSASDISAKNKWYSTVTDGYVFYKCKDITIPHTTGYDRLLLVNFLIHTNTNYHANADNRLNSCILRPYTVSRTDGSQIIFNEDPLRGDYSFNPLTFFNLDLSSKVYNVYGPQTNTVYVYSFKPVFK